ncbi:hypothetical protein NSB25_21055 [Acetatifactor muris]|uniref:Uncharacterized protein n=1 Tax=Acetatifactor muris TaxID=879566 RepID=A0A2K4ZLU5_9FIRM|nr:hypothetical protein [Acetatifactor muris]MCR2049748.1 hypothetical protein [Acetatifactor muris]SOY31448.1 hypothetical protein AMURIS_04191 [Acetatifactor muris]
MECRNCPYGKEDFMRRMLNYEKIVSERRIPNDICHYLKPENASDEFERFLWCDKVGGKVFWAGRCEDAYIDIPKRINHKKQKRRSKRERDQKHKNHLKFLAENVPEYPYPVIYTDEILIRGHGYVENPKPYYKRLYRGRGRHSNSNYHKKMSNKKIRRYRGELSKKGNLSHRLYDFWWELC